METHDVSFVEQGGLQIRFELLHKWTNKYQRNNKRTGLKNLRCFPYCSEPHKDKGFCGNAVRMTVRRLEDGPRDPIFAWAEFRRTDLAREIDVGSIVHADKMIANERHKLDPRLPYYRGEVYEGSSIDVLDADEEEEEQKFVTEKRRRATSKKDLAKALEDRSKEVVQFAFNRQRRGWNYSWAANKHTGNATHALFVYIMIPAGEDLYRCIAVVAGPAFVVFCRKRPSDDDREVETGPSTIQLAKDIGPVKETPNPGKGTGAVKSSPKHQSVHLSSPNHLGSMNPPAAPIKQESGVRSPMYGPPSMHQGFSSSSPSPSLSSSGPGLGQQSKLYPSMSSSQDSMAYASCSSSTSLSSASSTDDWTPESGPSTFSYAQSHPRSGHPRMESQSRPQQYQRMETHTRPQQYPHQPHPYSAGGPQQYQHQYSSSQHQPTHSSQGHRSQPSESGSLHNTSSEQLPIMSHAPLPAHANRAPTIPSHRSQQPQHNPAALPPSSSNPGLSSYTKLDGDEDLACELLMTRPDAQGEVMRNGGYIDGRTGVASYPSSYEPGMTHENLDESVLQHHHQQQSQLQQHQPPMASRAPPHNSSYEYDSHRMHTPTDESTVSGGGMSAHTTGDYSHTDSGDNETDEFRRFFIDAFWADEGPTIDEFSSSRGAPKRSRNVQTPPMEPILSLNTFSTNKLDNVDFGAEEVPKSLPTPPPLKPMLKREEAHREDPPPPKEISAIFGQPLDTEEDAINAKVWRLVLVLALIEAHWCSMGNNKRGMVSPSATSTAGVGGSVPEPIPGHATDMFSRILQNDALPNDLPESVKANQEHLFALQREQRRLDAEHRASQEHGGQSTNSQGPVDRYLTHMSDDNREVVRQLATFLVEEQSFTRAIEKTLNGLPPNSSMKRLKMAFIKVTHEQLNLFCESYGLTLYQFDRLFEDQPNLSFLKQAAVRLKMLNETMAQYKDTGRETISSAFVPDPSNKKGRYNMSLPASLRDQHVNISGVYEMDDSLSEAHAFFRELRGVPWTLRTMIGYIEKTMNISQTCYERIYMQGQRKLLSNGGNLYITDGRLRKFTLLSPVPWSRPLAEYYRAWFAEPYFYLVHYYSETDRLTRVIHYQPYRLHFRISAERLDLVTNEWQTIETREGFANLVRPAPNFNADKWTTPSFASDPEMFLEQSLG